MAPKRTRRNKKQKGGVLTYEQEQYIKHKEVQRQLASGVRQAGASTDPVLRQAPTPAGQQWQQTLAAGLPNKRATSKRKRKN
jgi:midasin (ATPase involved in ribosome maturation)